MRSSLWLWLAIIAGVLLASIAAINMARGDDDDVLIPPTAQEAEDIKEWIPVACCRTQNCCRKVKASAIQPITADLYRIAATGQEIVRKSWSRDGQTWRCTCDQVEGGWRVHLKAKTHCVFPALSGS